MKDKILRIISESMINDEDYLDMIASSNYIDKEVRDILSSILSNKITKGNIKGRKYINSKYADEIENLTIEEAKKTFECKYANASCNSLLIASNLAYDVLCYQHRWPTVPRLVTQSIGTLTNGITAD